MHSRATIVLFFAATTLFLSAGQTDAEKARRSGVAAAANPSTFEGVVQTTNGGRFEGRIRLEKNGFTIMETNGSAQKVSLEELLLLRARLAPAAAEAHGVSEVSRRAAGVQLTGGSFIARHIQLADDTWIRFSDSPREAALSTVSVARIFFQPPTAQMESKLLPGRTGLLLKNSDFIESEFKGISRGKIRISSVLFGLKSFDPAKVQALALRDPRPVTARFEVRTRSNSCLLVNVLSVEKDRLTIQDSAMAGLQIMAGELMEIRKCQ